MQSMPDTELMDVPAIINLAAQDTIFYGHYYFPNTIRQDTPDFHVEICQKVDSNIYEKIALKVFRGGAKTTLARVIISKRIAFAISRTILIVSETAEHSYESVKWLKHQVEKDTQWARDFGLERGDKHTIPDSSERYTWRDDKIQIVNSSVLDANGRPVIITIVGTGIFGQSRGLNIEDYRPDFILLDDVVDEDNAKTEEQRKKVNERIYGAILNTLAPRSESPTAMLLFLQTPLHMQDAIELSAKDPEWLHLVYSCFDENGNSRWPARFPTEVLRSKKAGFIARNMLSLWMKEMEVTVTSNELAYFQGEWMLEALHRTGNPFPNGLSIYMGVDPTPPPKDTEQRSSQALMNLDNACISVIGCAGGHVFDLDMYVTKSPLPTELISKILELAVRWRVMRIGFESILFARTTKFYLEQNMMEKRIYIPVMPIEDRRKKSDRIRQTLTDLFFYRRMHLRESNQELQAEYLSYPDVDHDDRLDALSIAVLCRNPGDIIEGEFEVLDDEEDIALLGNWRGCPSGE